MILKKSESKKIDLKQITERFDGCSITIDYPTVEQNENIRELFFQLVNTDPELMGKETIEALTPEQEAKKLIISEKIGKAYIKYCIRDWEGFITEDGVPIPFETVNNVITPKLFNLFISNLTYEELIKLGNLIQSEVSFTDTDKKK